MWHFCKSRVLCHVKCFILFLEGLIRSTLLFYLCTHSRRRSYKLNKQIAWICSYYATVIKWKLSNHFTMRWQLLEFTDCYHIYITECGRVTVSLTNFDFQHCQTIERNKRNNEMTWACLSGIILYLIILSGMRREWELVSSITSAHQGFKTPWGHIIAHPACLWQTLPIWLDWIL